MDPRSPARAPMTVETLFRLRMPLDAQLSPDGALVAFILSAWPLDAEPRSKPRGRLWLVGADGGDEARAITPGGADARDDACPRWSPDGRLLAFVSTLHPATREGEGGDELRPGGAVSPTAQLYLLARDALERPSAEQPAAPRHVVSMPNGVGELAWSPDGGRLAFLSLEGAAPGGEPVVVGPGRHQRLWTTRPESGAPEPVTPPDLTVWSYAWAPDGQSFAIYYSDGPDETDWYRGQLGIVPAQGGAARRIGQLTRQAAALRWARDGQRVYYISGEWSDRPLVGGDIHAQPITGGEPRNLTPGIGFSPSWMQELPDGSGLLYAGWDGLAHQLGALRFADGALTPLARGFVIGERAQPRVSATPDARRVALVRADAGAMPEVWLAELPALTGGQPAAEPPLTWRRLTRLNALVEQTVASAPNERIHYSGADGWTIDALFTPPLRPPADGAPPPLVVIAHGGPSSAFRDSAGDFDGGWRELFAAAGYATLCPNVRGSVGRGVAFADAVLGDMGGKDFADLLRGIDTLVEQGRVDGARVGVFGWSYGGFLVAWAVSQSERFRAAVMGAGICDFHSFHAQSNIPDWDMRFLAADPLTRPEVYRERSAITYAARVTTPTLIVHGEQDDCVPVNQGYAFYRALRERGTPVELAVYPREGHAVRERAHVRDLDERILRWFAQYL